MVWLVDPFVFVTHRTIKIYSPSYLRRKKLQPFFTIKRQNKSMSVITMLLTLMFIPNSVTDEFQAGELYYDTYQVYTGQADGTLKTIVTRPWWYWIFHFGVDWCIAFSGAVIFGISMFLETRKEWNSVKKGLLIKDKEVAFILKYYRITSIVQGVYLFANVLVGFFGGFLILGIIPLVLHFILSSAILGNRLGKYVLTLKEKTAFGYWNLMRIITIILAFFSVIIVGVMIG